MKKLGIALAVVAMAACSQAAMVQWQFTATKTAAANGDGNTVYMILASTWEGSDAWTAGAIEGAAVSQANFAIGGKSANTSPTNYKSADLGIGDTINYYLVMVDSTSGKYFASDKQTSLAAVADGVNDKDELGAIIPAGQPSAKVFAAGTALAESGNWSGGAVPEPTSAMLMLLGAAGLALKRKRA